MDRKSKEIKINSFSLKSVITEEDVRETLNSLMIALENKNAKSLELLHKNYQKLISISNSKLRLYFEKNNLKFTFANFLKTAINKPIGEWLLKDEFKNKKYSCSILADEVMFEFGFLNESILDYLNGYTDKRNDEQNLIRGMLTELRSHSMDSTVQDVYTLVRDNLVAKNGLFEDRFKRPISNIWEEKDKLMFEARLRTMNVHINFPDTYNFIKYHCFEKIVGPQTIELCNNCGLPLRYKNGILKCINDVTCRHNSLVKTETRRVMQLNDYDVKFKVKDGIAYFITRVGIEETLIYDFIKAKYEPLGWEVLKYPGQDAIGDVMMRKNGIVIVIDLKDFVNPKDLYNEISNNPGQYSTKDIIYIPQYRKDIYENKKQLESLKSLLKSKNLRSKDGRNPVLAYNDNYGTSGNLVETINKIIAEKERKLEMECVEQCQMLI